MGFPRYSDKPGYPAEYSNEARRSDRMGADGSFRRSLAIGLN